MIWKRQKYYWVAMTIIKKNKLVGQPNVAMGQAVLNRHPLEWMLEKKDGGELVQLQNWKEIPKDIFDKTNKEMREGLANVKI